MAVEQDWLLYSAQTTVAPTDEFLARTTAGAGVRIPGSAFTSIVSQPAVSPKDFGAVGNGTTDDYTAMLNALQSGKPVDGGGLTYAIGTPLAPTSFKGLSNCILKWSNTTIMATQNFLLSIINIGSCYVENVRFDLGTVENTGSADDSGRGGLKITTTSENVTFSDYVYVANCHAYGFGNGTGFYLRSLRYSVFTGLRVYGRQVAFSPDPTNDCQNGIDVSKCRSVSLSNCVSRDQQTRLAGTLVKRFSRAFVITETHDSGFTNNHAVDTDQGFDFSGAITATLTQGNRNLAITGCTAAGNYTYGFKFANCAHDIVISGCTARDFGFCGFVFSSPTTTPVDATKNTQSITVTGCHAFDPSGLFAPSNCYGFRIMQGAGATGYPRGIKMTGCTVRNTLGGTNLNYGFFSDVTYDGTSGLLNELIGCRSIGHTTGAASGFNQVRTVLTDAASQSLTTAVAAPLTWTTETYDGPNAHDNATNAELITVKMNGTYRIACSVVFASNATGFRKVILFKNGGTVAGGLWSTAAVNGDVTTVSGSLLLSLVAGDAIKIEATQNSGGALNVNKFNSVFSAELVELA